MTKAGARGRTWDGELDGVEDGEGPSMTTMQSVEEGRTTDELQMMIPRT